jgi:4-oxalocrotonate tautomerase
MLTGKAWRRPLPYVRVEIAKGIANTEQKRAVIRRMTEVLVEELDRNPEYIFVVIDEIDTDNWGRKGVSLSELWQQAETTETISDAQRTERPEAPGRRDR